MDFPNFNPKYGNLLLKLFNFIPDNSDQITGFQRFIFGVELFCF